MRANRVFISIFLLCAVSSLNAQSTQPSHNWKLTPLSEVKVSAEAGIAGAQLEYGSRIEAGRGMKKDADEAIDWYRKAAAQGDIDAELLLASHLIDGTAVEQKEATQLYERAAGAGNAQAARLAGECYRDGKGVLQDDSKALEYFKQAAAKGDAVAEYDVGVCYRKGAAAPADPTEAAKWLKQSANAGNSDATAELASMMRNGEGVPKDEREALSLYQKAAAKGSTVAQWELARMYRDGDGVPRDQNKALLWMKKLVIEKYEPAQAALGQFNIDEFKKAAKPVVMRAGAIDESQLGALVKLDGEVISTDGGSWKIGVKSFIGKQYIIQVTPPTYVPPAAEKKERSSRKSSANSSRVRVLNSNVDSTATGAVTSPGVDPAKVKEGMQVTVWGTLLDQKTVKGIVCQLAPPSFEWSYKLEDVAGVRAGSQTFTVDVSFKNTGTTPLKNVVLHLHVAQNSSQSNTGKDLMIDHVNVGETIQLKIDLRLYNQSSSGGTSKPKIDLEVTGYEY